MPIYHQMNYRDYANLDGLRASTIRDAAALSWAHALGRSRKDSDTMRVGTYLHAAIVRDTDALSRFRSDAPINPRTGNPYGIGTKAMEEYLASLAPGESYISAAERAEYDDAALSVRDHPSAGPMVAAGKAEVSFAGMIEGVPCKARVDLYDDASGTWSDIKTTRLSARDFPRQAARMGYWLQAAFHARVIEAATKTRPPHARWIVLEQEPPYGIVVYHADLSNIIDHDQAVTDLVRQYAEIRRTGVIPGYPSHVVSLSCPQWAIPIVTDQSEQEEVYW